MSHQAIYWQPVPGNLHEEKTFTFQCSYIFLVFLGIIRHCLKNDSCATKVVLYHALQLVASKLPVKVASWQGPKIIGTGDSTNSLVKNFLQSKSSNLCLWIKSILVWKDYSKPCHPEFGFLNAGDISWFCGDSFSVCYGSSKVVNIFSGHAENTSLKKTPPTPQKGSTYYYLLVLVI